MEVCSCILFDNSSTNHSVFATNPFQNVSKPEKVKWHTKLQYQLATIIKTQCFVNSYKDPTSNIDSDAEEEKLYYKTFMF